MTGPPPAERLFSPAFIALGVAELCYFTAVGVSIYALPLTVTGPIGGNEAMAGLAFGAFALSALMLRPVAGRLADTLGRRPLLLGGALTAALSLALLAGAAVSGGGTRSWFSASSLMVPDGRRKAAQTHRA